MLSRTRTIDPRLMQRQCVVCGYDGALLRRGRAERCARCGCDLRERPARSYAEMEGLAPARPVVRPPRASLAPSVDGRILRRWAFFGLGVLAALSAVVTLFLAMFSS